MNIGVLIINIGTPESPSKKDVSVYLKKFLMDEDVISIPFIFRWILVHLIIVPFRAKKSAAKYKKIWTQNGSPLKINTDLFVNKLQKSLLTLNKNSVNTYSVKSGMVFSEPSIEEALIAFKNEAVDQIIICPMFPQYAEATTGSILKNVNYLLKKINLNNKINSIKSFYNQNFYIDQITAHCKNTAYSKNIDHWVFSYHGLPESQVLKNKDCQLSFDCCLSEKQCTKTCYRSHSLQTTQLVADRLKLNKSDYTISFQSRLGRDQWLRPYTDDILKNLPLVNKKNIAIVSPAFVVDCLETLEEIDIESRSIFISHGGLSFNYVTCLNDDLDWVTGFANYILNGINFSEITL